ncbi:MAG: YcxB family protein [Fimbriimonadaceae bacterium]
MNTWTSEPYDMSRWEVARVTSAYYMRKLWWLFFSMPVVGLYIFATNRDALAMWFGAFAVLWPATVPLRQWYFLAGKAGTMYDVERQLRIAGSNLEVLAKNGRNVRSKVKEFKRIVPLMNHLLLFNERGRFLIVPERAFRDREDRDRFIGLLRLKD